MSIREPFHQSDAASPQSVDICLNCTSPTCSGNCDDFPKHTGQPAHRHAAIYEYCGESHTLPEWAELLGMPCPTLRKRLRNGMSFARAVKHDANQRQVRRYTVGGESHTLKEWSDITGVPYSTIVQRLACGVEIEYAIRRGRVKYK